MSKNKSSETDLSVYTISLTELKNRKSKVWNYIGILKKNGLTSDSDYFHCLPCLQGNEPTLKPVLKPFRRNTATGSMKLHLENFHKIAIDAVDTSQQTKMTSFLPSDSASSISATQESSQELPVKRSLKLLKAGLNLCYRELLDTDIISGGALKGLVSDFTTVRKNNDTCEESVLEELKNNADDLQVKIRNKILESNANVIYLRMIDVVSKDFEQFLILNVSYLNEKDWTLQNSSLSFTAKQWNESLSLSWLKSSLTSYDISDKPIKFLSRKTVLNRKTVENIPCIGYTLASILHINIGIKILDVYNKVMSMFQAAFFMADSLTTNDYKKITEIVQVISMCQQISFFAETELKKSLPPWFIQLYILQTFMELKDCFLDVLETADLTVILPKTEDFLLIQNFIDIYKSFMVSIEHIYSTDEPFNSSKLVVINYLTENLTKLLTDIKNESIAAIIKEILSDLEKKLVISDTDILASLLDIRCNSLKSTTNHLKKLGKTAKQVIKDFTESEDIDSQITVSASTSKKQQTGSKSLFTSRSIDVEPQTISLDSEIDQFLNVKDKTEAILPWWKENEVNFTTIAILAKKYLPTLITALPKEFYYVGYVGKLHKISNLNANVKEKIAFIHFNTI